MDTTEKGLNFLVYDFGISVELALRLVDGLKNHVQYYTDWPSGLPKFEEYAAGLGYEKEGLEKVLYFFDHIKDADCIVFPFIGAGDLCNYLRETTSIPIFGAGLGEKLENDRKMLRDVQERLGLPTQHTEFIMGLQNLREYLKVNPNKVVKINIFRGDVETFVAKDYDSVELVLDKLSTRLGAFQDQYEFMVEDFIEGIEVGYDLFFNGTEYLKPVMWGMMGGGDIGVDKFDDELPEPLKKIADAMIPVLTNLNYHGFISNEARVTPQGIAYLTDLTTRFPYPVSSGFLDGIKNFPEVIYAVAKGENVKLEPAGKYIMSAPMRSQEAKELWINVKIEDKFRKYIKTYESAQKDGKLYAVKGTEMVAVATSASDSLEKLEMILTKLMEKVDAYGLDKDSVLNIKKVIEDTQNFVSYGLGEF